MLLPGRILDLYKMIYAIEALLFKEVPDALFIVDNTDPICRL
jgi:hypothetical protein